MLEISAYIRQTNVADEPITYDWNDKFPALKYSKVVPALQKQISGMSTRAMVALAAGSAEWILERLSKQKDGQDPLPHQCVEAVWASIADWKHFKLGFAAPIRSPDWTGTVRGPLYAVMHLLEEIVASATKHTGTYVSRTVDLSNLYAYITKDPKVFYAWRRPTIRRLLKLFPYEKGKPGKFVVAPQVLEPEFDYKPEMGKGYVEEYLKGLDPKTNPFLNSL